MGAAHRNRRSDRRTSDLPHTIAFARAGFGIDGGRGQHFNHGRRIHYDDQQHKHNTGHKHHSDDRDHRDVTDASPHRTNVNRDLDHNIRNNG